MNFNNNIKKRVFLYVFFTLSILLIVFYPKVVESLETPENLTDIQFLETGCLYTLEPILEAEFSNMSKEAKKPIIELAIKDLENCAEIRTEEILRKTEFEQSQQYTFIGLGITIGLGCGGILATWLFSRRGN